MYNVQTDGQKSAFSYNVYSHSFFRLYQPKVYFIV